MHEIKSNTCFLMAYVYENCYTQYFLILFAYLSIFLIPSIITFTYIIWLYEGFTFAFCFHGFTIRMFVNSSVHYLYNRRSNFVSEARQESHSISFQTFQTIWNKKSLDIRLTYNNKHITTDQKKKRSAEKWFGEHDACINFNQSHKSDLHFNDDLGWLQYFFSPRACVEK